MPGNLSALSILVLFAVPGLLYYVQRRALAPQRSLSPFVETASLVAVSAFTNLAALGLFALVRKLLPRHTPNVQSLLRSPGDYVVARPGYMLAWVAALLVVSSGLAVLLGRRWWILGKIADKYTPTIVDISSWYRAAEHGPDGARVHVGCDMSDGVFVSGYLDWYSTELDETGDRDLILADGITRIADGQEETLECQRLVVSGREIRRMYVTYVLDASSGE